MGSGICCEEKEGDTTSGQGRPRAAIEENKREGVEGKAGCRERPEAKATGNLARVLPS